MSEETTNEHERGHWAGRPAIAWTIKFVAWLTPIAVSAIACYFIAQAFPRPANLLPTIVWFVGLSVVATGILFAVDKLARRLLPLAALFNLSLIFPDRAPPGGKILRVMIGGQRNPELVPVKLQSHSDRGNTTKNYLQHHAAGARIQVSQYRFSAQQQDYQQCHLSCFFCHPSLGPIPLWPNWSTPI